MTTAEIGRLRVVCLASGPASAAALRARRRLERVARDQLPDALSRELVDAPSTELARVRVRLDLDPDAYDDVTLATLWASRIRTAVEEAAARAPIPAPSWPSSLGDGPDAPERIDAAAQPDPAAPVPAVARRAARGDRSALAAVVGAVVRGGAPVARAIAAALEPSDAAALHRILGRRPAPKTPGHARRRRPAAVSGALRRPGFPVEGPSTRRALVRALLRAATTEQGRGGRAADDPRSAPPAGSPAVPAQRPGRPAAPARPARAPHATTVGGLVLLWPWLAERLSAAVAALPSVAAPEARRAALAAFTPDVADAVDDPLVRLLSGDVLAAPPSSFIVDADDLATLVDQAAAVLAAFAAAIPGFGGSTPGFIRDELLVRDGWLDPTSEPVAVILERRPLDPALALLPYPLGVFRLPWTAPISVRLEDR